MPYIRAEDRAKFHLHAAHGAEGIKLVADNAGELQYCIALLVKAYLTRQAPWRYQHLNDVIGALEGAKLELYRRVVAPYENAKRAQHGDVYD
jgi:hypothetical protein